MKKFLVAACMMGALLAALVVNAAETNTDSKKQEQIKRGEHLVKAGLCADCHTPKVMGPNGPEEDNTRMLSGHPGDMALPPPPALPEGPWGVISSWDLTAWSGPWGVSFPRNLTPDKETGLGDWTEQNFIDTIRSGRRMGKGRAILPPMPIAGISNYTDDELKAIFAYLQSIPAIHNPVPEPIPPPAPKSE